MYPSETVALIELLNKKHESENFVLLPLEESKEPYMVDIVNIGGKDVLRIPKNDFDSWEKQYQIGQIMWSNAASSGSKQSIEKFLPKKPWAHIERKYLLNKEINEQQS